MAEKQLGLGDQMQNTEKQCQRERMGQILSQGHAPKTHLDAPRSVPSQAAPKPGQLTVKQKSHIAFHN